MGVQSVLGGEVLWHCEVEDAPSRILAHHWPDVPNLGDITAVDWHSVPRVDVLTGGYPCQPFSLAGQRDGATDRRHMWPHVADGISVLRPRLCVFENVRGHLTLGFDEVLRDLHQLGYRASWMLVRASEVGAPHARARIFIFAERGRHDAGEDATGGLPLGLLVGAERRPDGAGRVQREDPFDGADGGGAPIRDGAARYRASVFAAPADAEDVGHERGRGTRPGWTGPENGGDAPADASRIGWDQWRPESAGIVRGLDAPERGSPLAPDADSDAVRVESVALAGSSGAPEPGWHGEAPADADDAEPTAWGPYAPAIDRWAAALGRPAPPPTELGPKGAPRLSSRFVEWMQGLPAGHVTDVPGISRNDQLKALGNGVVPAQSAAATRWFLSQIGATA